MIVELRYQAVARLSTYRVRDGNQSLASTSMSTGACKLRKSEICHVDGEMAPWCVWASATAAPQSPKASLSARGPSGATLLTSTPPFVWRIPCANSWATASRSLAYSGKTSSTKRKPFGVHATGYWSET